MSYTIWKFPLIVDDQQYVSMPAGAEILCVQMQRLDLCMWALVDDSQPTVQREILIRGTGHPCGIDHPNVRYIGSVQMSGGALVFHVFEGNPA